MYVYSTGTSRLSVWRSYPYQPKLLGRGTTDRTPAGQDAAAEDSIFCTDEVTSLLSCGGMMYDRDMPFLFIALFRT